MPAGNRICSLQNKIDDTDDVGLPGTIWPHHDQGTAVEAQVESSECQHVLNVQRVNDQDRSVLRSWYRTAIGGLGHDGLAAALVPTPREIIQTPRRHPGKRAQSDRPPYRSIMPMPTEPSGQLTPSCSTTSQQSLTKDVAPSGALAAHRVSQSASMTEPGESADSSRRSSNWPHPSRVCVPGTPDPSGLVPPSDGRCRPHFALHVIKGLTTMTMIRPLTCYFSCSPDRI